MPRVPTVLSSAGSTAASAVGHGLAAAIATLRLLPRTKPLHARGRLYDATLVVDGLHPPAGVPLLDDPGEHAALVRLSRATGLPEGWPDIEGVAVRVPGRAGGDLLFASTGTGPVGRWVLTPHRGPGHAVTSLLPFRTAWGATWLALVPAAEGRWQLLAAGLGRAWSPCGEVVLGARVGSGDEQPRFEPVGSAPPGLQVPATLARLRVPAYRWARAGHGGRAAAPVDGRPDLEPG